MEGAGSDVARGLRFMKIALIVAVADNGVIGRNNALPWRLPEDLRYFKRVTLGKPIVMGRRTFESIGRPLPGRHNIVVSRAARDASADVHWVSSPQQALQLARTFDPEEAMVIVGEKFYREFLPVAYRLYITRVHAVLEGDAFFPHYEPLDWIETSSREGESDGGASHACRFVVLERRYPLSPDRWVDELAGD